MLNIDIDYEEELLKKNMKQIDLLIQQDDLTNLKKCLYNFVKFKLFRLKSKSNLKYCNNSIFPFNFPSRNALLKFDFLTMNLSSR